MDSCYDAAVSDVVRLLLGIHSVGALLHLLSDLVATIVHVLERLLVLAVLSADTHLGYDEGGGTNHADGADEHLSLNHVVGVRVS